MSYSLHQTGDPFTNKAQFFFIYWWAIECLHPTSWFWRAKCYHVAISLILIQITGSMQGQIHRGRATHICVSNVTVISTDKVTSPYLNEWRDIVDLNVRNKLKKYVFIQENENVACEMTAIVSRPQCIDTVRLDQNGKNKLSITFSIRQYMVLWFQLHSNVT